MTNLSSTMCHDCHYPGVQIIPNKSTICHPVFSNANKCKYNWDFSFYLFFIIYLFIYYLANDKMRE
uniref:Uncharacterized protein n=1 Tax=Arundo donax TaxID=35708 RepID=A0A0A8YUF4_ARUDO